MKTRTVRRSRLVPHTVDGETELVLDHYDVEVSFHGVIPMAMRGQAVPMSKRLQKHLSSLELTKPGLRGAPSEPSTRVL